MCFGGDNVQKAEQRGVVNLADLAIFANQWLSEK